MLYAEKPHPFYELYVCNDIGSENKTSNIHIKNATIEMLEEKSKHIIIQGTGGIGKSMLLTHLFLSSAANTSKTGRMGDWNRICVNTILFDKIILKNGVFRWLKLKVTPSLNKLLISL